jgi:hypothetical protein
MARVRQTTIPTEWPQIVGEVSAKFCRLRVPHDQHDKSPWPLFRFSRPEPLLFFPSNSSVVLTRLSGPRSRPTTSQKIWWRRESNPTTDINTARTGTQFPEFSKEALFKAISSKCLPYFPAVHSNAILLPYICTFNTTLRISNSVHPYLYYHCFAQAPIPIYYHLHKSVVFLRNWPTLPPWSLMRCVPPKHW